jgi:hypothetical protein
MRRPNFWRDWNNKAEFRLITANTGNLRQAAIQWGMMKFKRGDLNIVRYLTESNFIGQNKMQCGAQTIHFIPAQP